jgi:hypothetical protein
LKEKSDIELDCHIAELLGGKPYEMSEVDYWHSPQSSTGNHWKVRRSNGDVTSLPNYSTSLKDACKLITNIDGQAEGIFSLSYWPKDNTGRSQMWRATCLVLKYEAWSDNPATAICKAWLSWRESL